MADSEFDVDDFFADVFVVSRCYKEENVPEDLHPAVPQFLGSLSAEEIQTLNRPDLITPQTPINSPWRGATSADTWDGEQMDRVDIIKKLAHEDKVELRRNLSDYPLDLELVETNMEHTEFLEFCRDIRRAFPSGNIISKREQQEGEALTLDKFDFPEIEEEDTIFFGNAHLGHKASLLPQVIVNYDPNSEEQAPAFRKGTVQNWREAVEETPDATVIMSDAAVGDTYGFVYDHSLTKHYREMCEAGFDVVYKTLVSEAPVGPLIDWRKVCPHNEEIVYWVSKHRTPLRQFPGVHAMVEACKAANTIRTRKVIVRNHKFRWKNKGWFRKLPYIHGALLPKKTWVKMKAINRFEAPSVNDPSREMYHRRCLKNQPGVEIAQTIEPDFPGFFSDFLVPTAAAADAFNIVWTTAIRNGLTPLFDKALGWYVE